MKTTVNKRVSMMLSAFAITFVFAVGISASLLLSLLVSVLVTSFFAVLLLIIRKQRKVQTKAALVLTLILAFAGAFCASLYKNNVKNIEALAGNIHDIEGYVCEVGYRGDGYMYCTVRTEKINGEPHGIKILLRITGESLPEYYENIEIISHVKLIDEDDSYLRADGIYVMSECEGYISSGTHGKTPEWYLNYIKRALCDRYSEIFTGENSTLAAAILLGEKSGLSPETKLMFRRSGVSHVLAVSGLHLSVVIGGIYFILKRLRVHIRTRGIISAVLIVFFSLLTGFSASVFRAGVMMGIMLFSELIGRQYDAQDALFTALFLLLALSPSSVYDTGMWLSFSASFGIIISSDRSFHRYQPDYGIKRYIMKLLYFLYDASVTTLAALIFTLPVVYTEFGAVSLLTVPVNLIVIPVAQLLLYSLTFFSLVCFIPYVSVPFSFAADKLMDILRAVTGRASEVNNNYISIDNEYMPYIIIGLIMAVAAMIFFRKARKRHLLSVYIITLLLMLTSVVSSVNNTYVISYAANGGGDTVCIEDCGETTVIQMYGKNTYTYDKSVFDGIVRGTYIEKYIITSLDKYTEKSVYDIFEKYRIGTLCIPLPYDFTELTVHERICDRALYYGCETAFYNRNEEYTVNGKSSLKLYAQIYTENSTEPLIILEDTLSNGRTLLYLGSGYERFYPYIIGSADTVIYGSGGLGYFTKIKPAGNHVISYYVKDSFLREYINLVTAGDGEITRISGKRE